MSHPEQKNFVSTLKNKLPSYFNQKKVLEVGSLNINGTLRDFFADCEYIGLDLDDGPGVDIVCAGQDYDAPDESYDVVCSAECFEHNPYWYETFMNMVRLCKPNGLVFFTCATEGRPEHGTIKSLPVDSPFTISIGWGDYYKNLVESDFTNKVNFKNFFKVHEFSKNEQSKDLYFYGVKWYKSPTSI